MTYDKLYTKTQNMIKFWLLTCKSFLPSY